MAFPSDFVWGCATAAYQIEGGAFEDGKGRSIWDVFSHTPGKISRGDTGDVACDHYHRRREDVALMKEVGLKGYRFSLSWPRILPEGVGKTNRAGLDFYDQLVDELLAANIQPWVTLFHWDYPHALYLKGGWLNPESSEWFAEYTRVVVERLSDRVTHWMTLNEPQCFVGLGHVTGLHAPGLKLPKPDVARIAHNVLLSHGKAAQVIRAGAKKPPLVGWAPVGAPREPACETPEDIEAARRETFACHDDPIDCATWWSDPAILGHYPADGLKAFGSDMPKFPSGDMDTIRQPMDFYAFNCYFSQLCRMGADGKPETVARYPGYPRTRFTWPVSDNALYWGARFFHERYKLPIVVTENGMSGLDWVSLDGKVHDPLRIDFLTRYLRGVRRALDEGIPVKGYFLWSFTDNFEWARGYDERFGIVHCDFVTLKRTPKDSARWYAEVIRNNGANL